MALNPLNTDPMFLRHTFLVIDFEALTPVGRPAEPIEVAVTTLLPDGQETLREDGRFETLIRPPDDVAVTVFDTAQTGIDPAQLERAAPAATVMAELDARMSHPPYRLVAHHAPTEANLIAHQREHCPTLACTPLLDSVRLARRVYPELASHSLDAVLRHLGIPVPAGRHRAMPDVEATGQIFQRMLDDGARQDLWSTLHGVEAIGRVEPKPTPAVRADQTSLF